MRSSPDRAEPGFSLIELMATVTIMGVVVVVIFSTLFRTSAAEQYAATIAHTRQTARAAVQQIERDVRMAGSGWGRLPLNVYNSGAFEVWWAVRPGPGNGPCDSLRLIGAWNSASLLAADMIAPTSDLRVDGLSGFAPGNLCVVTDGSSAHMFQITSINTGTKSLVRAATSPFNPTGTFSAWPAGGYPAGRTHVYPITLLTYRVDSTTFRRPTLVRYEFGRTPAVVMHDVSALQLWYRPQGTQDSLTRTPAYGVTGMPLIDRIQPRVFTRAVVEGRAVVVDSAWSEIQPRSL